MNFIKALCEVVTDEDLCTNLRKVDQLHPKVATNLWLFGEDWILIRSESVVREASGRMPFALQANPG
ncbi:hypothetical protein PUR57_02480 [Streptomyces sp. JV176]|uniref:hypothetical protein n=1 Tax=Streptomyces sp. JV176 TaxID=858630 RepID=UPI002E78E285|nr:hypothetical protein [Streptomyces sp. JV176]MEE1797561.1 hypothetical protein [Streptomyces sp. JV176]